MAVWKTRSGKWGAKFQAENRRVQKKGFRTRADAVAWIADERKRLASGATRSISFHELSTEYLRDCQSKFRANTYRAKARYYRAFLAYAGGDADAEVSPETCRKYLLEVRESEGAKNANRHRKDLVALYNWGMRFGFSTNNPWRMTDRFPEEEFVRYTPPAGDIEAVLLAASGDDLDLLTVLYYTGGRIGEALRLEWDDVNMEKRWVVLKTRKRRGGELQSDRIAMPDALAKILSRRWRDRPPGSSLVFCRTDGSPWSYQSKRHLMRDLCVRAGVKRFGFHAIRHHVASILADSGKATLGQIQRFLRHRRQTTTETYLHELGRDQREVAGILEERLSGTTSGTTSVDDGGCDGTG